MDDPNRRSATVEVLDRIRVGGSREDHAMDTDDVLKKAFDLGMDDAEAEHQGKRQGQRSLAEVYELVGAHRGIFGDVRDAYSSGWSNFW